MKDRITISITPELHSALIMAALEHRISISRVIEITLREAEEFRSKFLPKVREYNEEGIELSAASPHSLKHIRNTPRDKIFPLSDLINFLEYSFKEFEELLENAKKSKFNDDRVYIYLQGYACALGDIIHALNYYFIKKGGEK